MKVGDYVTPNENFFIFWNCMPFQAKVIKIDNEIVYLENKENVYSKNTGEKIDDANFFHKCYLNVDVKKTREEKIRKIKIL